MFTVSSEDLAKARTEGFGAAMSEKVFRLIAILREINDRSESAGRYVLKGGTALNVFHAPELPRLSVDIDLIPVGPNPGASVAALKENLTRSTEKLLREIGFRTSTVASEGGSSISCLYRTLAGGSDQLKVDLDLTNRQTILEPKQVRGPELFNATDMSFPAVDRAELLGQKLVAVAYRALERDLYDMDFMLRHAWHELPRARNMYLAYSFLNDADWYRLAYPARLEVPYRPAALLDLLRPGEIPPSIESIRILAARTIGSTDPPFLSATERELSAKEQLLGGDTSQFAVICGEADASRIRRLVSHPGLSWRLQQHSRRR